MVTETIKGVWKPFSWRGKVSPNIHVYMIPGEDLFGEVSYVSAEDAWEADIESPLGHEDRLGFHMGGRIVEELGSFTSLQEAKRAVVNYFRGG